MPQPLHQPATDGSSVAWGNDLLAALRPADRALIEHHCTECRFAVGDVIFKPGDDIRHCYFPIGSAMSSLFVEIGGSTEVETILIGREGALGGLVSEGGLRAFLRASVVHEGLFQRIAIDDLNAAKQRSSAVANLFARYAVCAMAQVSQSIACNATHSIEQRTAKSLCAAMLRTGDANVKMTQEQLASIMGIGRSYASRVLQRFKREGLLRTRRGGFAVLDPAGLREKACGCNDQVSEHFADVLAGIYPQDM